MNDPLRAASQTQPISIPLDKYLLGEVPASFISRHSDAAGERPRSENDVIWKRRLLKMEPRYAPTQQIATFSSSQLQCRRRAAAISFAADALNRHDVSLIFRYISYLGTRNPLRTYFLFQFCSGATRGSVFQGRIDGQDGTHEGTGR